MEVLLRLYRVHKSPEICWGRSDEAGLGRSLGFCISDADAAGLWTTVCLAGVAGAQTEAERVMGLPQKLSRGVLQFGPDGPSWR